VTSLQKTGSRGHVTWHPLPDVTVSAVHFRSKYYPKLSRLPPSLHADSVTAASLYFSIRHITIVNRSSSQQPIIKRFLVITAKHFSISLHWHWTVNMETWSVSCFKRRHFFRLTLNLWSIESAYKAETPLLRPTAGLRSSTPEVLFSELQIRLASDGLWRVQKVVSNVVTWHRSDT